MSIVVLWKQELNGYFTFIAGIGVDKIFITYL